MVLKNPVTLKLVDELATVVRETVVYPGCFCHGLTVVSSLRREAAPRKKG